MATPKIVFNSGTGSDTAASGAGPGTALTGTAASYVTTTVTLDGSPNLSGVSTTGDAVLWLKTSSGRQFFTISGSDNVAKTVTTVDTPTGTASGLTWGIGGKRATWDNADSRKVFADQKAGWEIQTETDQSLAGGTLTLAAVLGDSTSGKIKITGSSDSPRPIITQTTNVAVFTCPNGSGLISFESLQLKNSNGTKTSANGFSVSSSQLFHFVNCILGDATNTLNIAITRGAANPVLVILDTEIKNCVGSGISIGTGQVNLYNSRIHDCGSHGITTVTTGSIQIQGSIIETNGGSGINLVGSGSTSQSLSCTNTTIHGNTADGITITNANGSSGMVVYNNIFTNNGGYGINGTSGNDGITALLDANIFGTGGTVNTSGTVNNFTSGPNSQTIDPQYTNAAGKDFSVGTAIKAAGRPLTSRFIGANQGATKSYVDPGAAQRQEPSSSGGISRARTQSG